MDGLGVDALARSRNSASLADFLQAVKRRRGPILQAVVLVPLVTTLLSFSQPHRYSASADILLSHHDLASSLSGSLNPDAGQDPNRLAQTQATIARVPLVAGRVLAANHLRDRTPDEFLRHSSATPSATSDILTLRVTDADRALAIRLVNSYAREFAVYSRQLDSAAFLRAERGVRQRLNQLKRAGQLGSGLYTNLLEKDDQLRTMAALGTSNATVLSTAHRAKQVQPRPVRNAVIGVFFGVLLGGLLAVLLEALDTRVRNAEEIASELRLPLLGRIPPPGRRLRRRGGLLMLADPGAPQAESFRILRSNVEFVTLERPLKSLLITSGLDLEGKSTTVANLAIAFARAGRRVIVVDLDLRRPALAGMFGLEGKPGLTDVALGQVELDAALAPVAIGRSTSAEATGNGHEQLDAVLRVLPTGPLPPAPGEFVGTHAVSEIIRELGSRADLVLVDAPPILRVGDALTVSSHVDALLVVTRLNIARRQPLRELRRLLASTPTPALGFVLTGATEEGVTPYEGYRPERPRRLRRRARVTGRRS